MHGFVDWLIMQISEIHSKLDVATTAISSQRELVSSVSRDCSLLSASIDDKISTKITEKSGILEEVKAEAKDLVSRGTAALTESFQKETDKVLASLCLAYFTAARAV
jgi:hypothetical protein